MTTFYLYDTTRIEAFHIPADLEEWIGDNPGSMLRAYTPIVWHLDGTLRLGSRVQIFVEVWDDVVAVAFKLRFSDRIIWTEVR